MPSPPPPGAGAEPRTPAAEPAEEPPAAWIRDHLDAVYRFARRRLDVADAEDVASEAFQALFTALERGAALDDPAAYLFGAARRRVADRLRRHARGLEAAALPEGWEGLCDAPLPPQAAQDRELAEAVHVALGLIAPSERDLLWARYRDGVSTAEFAARLAISEKAVEMRLYRARENLRGRLALVGDAWCEPPTRAEGGR